MTEDYDAMQSRREHLRELASNGGFARARKMTPEQRKESARKAVAARWAKEKAKRQQKNT